MFDAWKSFVSDEVTPFTIPGHKRRGAHLDAALGRLLDADVPLHGGADTVKLAAGVLIDAEQRAAQLWGADFCRFSTGGSTHANQAVCLALGRHGDTVLVSRTAHRSTLLGLVLAGLKPVWLPAEIDPVFGFPSGLSIPALEAALDEHPDAVAVLCVEPSYLGTMSDLADVAARVHRRDLPLVVDQAWGAHLGFAAGYPGHALSVGADAVVMSAHKTLPAFSQAALVLARGDRFDLERLDRAFEAAHTTSPSAAILASIDFSRALLASARGVELLEEVSRAVAELRVELRGLQIVIPDPSDFPAGRFDPAKLVLLLAGSGRSGLDVENCLLSQGIPLEMADRDTIVPLVSMLDDAQSLGRLRRSLVRAMAEVPVGAPRALSVAAQWEHSAPQLRTPREAFFAAHETVSAAAAVGRVSAEVIAPYPPGVAVMLPGEQITEQTLVALNVSAAAGTRIAYAADPSLETFQVVRED